MDKEFDSEQYNNSVKAYKDALKHNIKLLYRPPKRHKEFYELLTKDALLKDFLLSIFNFLKDKNIYTLNNENVAHLTTCKLIQISKKSKHTVSRYINYCCLLGLLEKRNDQGQESIISATIEWDAIEERGEKAKKPNLFIVPLYDNNKLTEIDKKIADANEKGIRKSNISFLKLAEDTTVKDAKNIYLNGHNGAKTHKDLIYKEFAEYMEMLVDSQGYATKKDLYTFDMSSYKIDKLLQIYSNDIRKKYNYKPPTKQEKVIFDLKSRKWIFTEKEK